MYIDGINSSTKSRPCHAVFHFFLSDDSKQDAATTTSHRKLYVQFLKLLMSSLSTVWENTDGFAEEYQCASGIYLMSVMSQSDSVICIGVSVQ